jgi:HEAT repeat protein
MQTTEPEVISALIQAVSGDANVNVRLAAIDALSKASGSAGVLRSLTQSLPMQDSPMVQAALIDYLVDAHDRQALGTLRKLALQPDLNPAVRERTHFALQQLSQ